tara:strand:- start:525 stop:1217 length:693 start_codon:yes stop_codon:yes gene_type:complete
MLNISLYALLFAMFFVTVPLYSPQVSLSENELYVFDKLRQQPEGGTLCWWDIGGYVQAYANKPTYLDSVAGQAENRVELLSEIFSEKNSSKVNKFLEQYDISYVIITPDLAWKTYAMDLPSYVEHTLTKEYWASNYPIRQYEAIHVLRNKDNYEAYFMTDEQLLPIHHVYFNDKLYENNAFMVAGGAVIVNDDKLVFVPETLDGAFLTSLLFLNGTGFSVDFKDGYYEVM